MATQQFLLTLLSNCYKQGWTWPNFMVSSQNTTKVLSCKFLTSQAKHTLCCMHCSWAGSSTLFLFGVTKGKALCTGFKRSGNHAFLVQSTGKLQRKQLTRKGICFGFKAKSKGQQKKKGFNARCIWDALFWVTFWPDSCVEFVDISCVKLLVVNLYFKYLSYLREIFEGTCEKSH